MGMTAPAPVLTVEFQEVEGTEDRITSASQARLCSLSKIDRPCPSHHTASPSIVPMPSAGLPRPHGCGAAAGEQPHLALPLAGNEAVAVVLNLVNPLRANRRLCRSGGVQGSIRPGRFAGGLARHFMPHRWIRSP
jgi:hypothetical protein